MGCACDGQACCRCQACHGRQGNGSLHHRGRGCSLLLCSSNWYYFTVHVTVWPSLFLVSASSCLSYFVLLFFACRLMKSSWLVAPLELWLYRTSLRIISLERYGFFLLFDACLFWHFHRATVCCVSNVLCMFRYGFALLFTYFGSYYCLVCCANYSPLASASTLMKLWLWEQPFRYWSMCTGRPVLPSPKWLVFSPCWNSAFIQAFEPWYLSNVIACAFRLPRHASFSSFSSCYFEVCLCRQHCGSRDLHDLHRL